MGRELRTQGWATGLTFSLRQETEAGEEAAHTSLPGAGPPAPTHSSFLRLPWPFLAVSAGCRRPCHQALGHAPPGVGLAWELGHLSVPQNGTAGQRQRPRAHFCAPTKQTPGSKQGADQW